MTITLTAAPMPGKLAVSLVLTVDGDAAELAALRRIDANGRADVRLPVLPSTIGLLTLADWEAALTGSLTYEAAIRRPDGTIERATTRATLESAAAPFSWILHPAVLPEEAVKVTFVDWAMPRTSHSTSTTVPGRPDPIINRQPLGMRSGTLELWCSSFADVQALERLAERSETILIRQNDFPGLDGYMEVKSVSPRIDRASARPGRVRWSVTMQLDEVARPGGPLLAPTEWTFDDVRTAFATFRDVEAAYLDLRSLLLDDRLGS